MICRNRCKTCGGIIEYDLMARQVECPSCGLITELGEGRTKFLDLYSRADDAWGRKDFDESMKLYEQIVAEDNTQSEAHWGVALSRYGVGYELDPISLKQMPVCNRINRDSILNDKNYLAAIKYATAMERARYEERAEEIERISKDFLKIVDKEPPRDVFIATSAPMPTAAAPSTARSQRDCTSSSRKRASTSSLPRNPSRRWAARSTSRTSLRH